MSSDLERSLNLQQEESESDCITNDMSFTEYDYPVNERGLSDEEGEGAMSTEWDRECILFEEELTDLDTDADNDDDDDLPMSEQDMEDSTSIAEDNFSATSKHLQPLKTCVQQELTPHHHHHDHHHHQQRFNKAFLQVNGAGLTALERELSSNSGEQHQRHGTAGNIGHGVDAAENGLADLIAEVERRRLHDFDRGPTLDHRIEGGSSMPSKREGSHGADMQREWSKSVPCATKERLSSDKISSDQNESVKGGVPAVKTCGETSASDVGVGSVGVSTPRGSDQPSPALTPSLFPGCLPPTIHFPMPDENCE